MKSSTLTNPLLRRYWFKTREHLGFGVTAYSIDDVRYLLDGAADYLGSEYEVLDVIEDVDIRDLDQNHVVPNMGPPSFRGVWYPKLTSG